MSDSKEKNQSLGNNNSTEKIENLKLTKEDKRKINIFLKFLKWEIDENSKEFTSSFGISNISLDLLNSYFDNSGNYINNYVYKKEYIIEFIIWLVPILKDIKKLEKDELFRRIDILWNRIKNKILTSKLPEIIDDIIDNSPYDILSIDMLIEILENELEKK